MIFRGSGFLLNFFFTFLVTINVYLCDDPKLSDNMVKMKAAKDYILKDYDKDIRPTVNGSNTTEVDTAFFPRQIIEVDEDRGLFTLDSFFWMQWQDPRLSWNSSVDYQGYLQLTQDLLWLPDISVYNSHSLSVNPTQKVLVIVSSTGDVIWIPPLFTQTSCSGLMESTYPYDEVECVIIMGAWAHDGWEIDFLHSHVLWMDAFVDINPRWQLVADKVKFVRNVTIYDQDPYLSMHIYFPMKRRPLPEIEVTRNPCILIMIITLSVFFLPPNSTKKIQILGIMFLVLTVLLVYVAWRTKYAIGVLLAVSFLQSTMYIVVVTFLLQVFVIFNLCNLTGPIRPPPAAMQLLSGPFGKFVCLQWPLDSNNNLPLDRMQLKEDDSPASKDSPTPNEDWLLFAAGLDRLFFVFVSIAMIAVHHL